MGLAKRMATAQMTILSRGVLARQHVSSSTCPFGVPLVTHGSISFFKIRKKFTPRKVNFVRAVKHYLSVTINKGSVTQNFTFSQLF
jgi:hypothetical protein